MFVKRSLLLAAITVPFFSNDPTKPEITVEDLKHRLYLVADDSMGGRGTGSVGHNKTVQYVAAELKRLGIEPAGENGTYFQRVPVRQSQGADVFNVVGVVRGSDARLRNTYVALGAHSDHVGAGGRPVDHDSAHLLFAARRKAVIERRPLSQADLATLRVQLDSIRRLRAPRPDTIRNGADDDGSGTVATLEIAEAIAKARVKPKRSVLFVWHAAEELGMVGSGYFTDHPTVPRDSIIAALNMDMIGRGGPGEELAGGPDYLQLIGWRRLSNELGDLIDAVNRERAQPFKFDLEYDRAGHPEQYYCRSDHWSYAKYGIPVSFFSTGDHGDYHQVTDEPQYIDYTKLWNVTRFIHDVALRLAGLPARPKIDGKVLGPNAECVQ